MTQHFRNFDLCTCHNSPGPLDNLHQLKLKDVLDIYSRWFHIYIFPCSQVHVHIQYYRNIQKRTSSERQQWTDTLQETNISHLGKRKIIFKYALSAGYVNSLEGISTTSKISTSRIENFRHIVSRDQQEMSPWKKSLYIHNFEFSLVPTSCLDLPLKRKHVTTAPPRKTKCVGNYGGFGSGWFSMFSKGQWFFFEVPML